MVEECMMQIHIVMIIVTLIITLYYYTWKYQFVTFDSTFYRYENKKLLDIRLTTNEQRLNNNTLYLSVFTHALLKFNELFESIHVLKNVKLSV